MVINIKNVLPLKDFPVLELGYIEQGDSTKWGPGIRDKSIIHVITPKVKLNLLTHIFFIILGNPRPYGLGLLSF